MIMPNTEKLIYNRIFIQENRKKHLGSSKAG